ncbi:MAG TPA: xanthine dehydrogenase molybdopterin binding subunit [Chthoniobacterales bacterium]|jgi:xanthine dehydrogenase molybdopterin binding subunit/xanthine dehydrogenase small subunit|nr:xanthine dehydrogenase molybdopterin binding subunit [Chthoniobacterales bacterium]
MSAIEFRLNGDPVRVDSVSPNLTLLEWLRNCGLTGSKEGCAEGDCGACSVAIVDRDARGKRCYRAINSCLVPLPLMAGRDIISVEGVGCSHGAASPCPGQERASTAPRLQLHPIQTAMVENFGSQCGYCTPGFIMSLFEGYYRKDLKTGAQLDEQLCGNLCRCTGYRPIRDAAADAFAKRNGSDPFDTQLKTAKTKLKAAKFNFGGEIFLRPATLEKLFRDIDEHPEARLIAGATDLGLEITKRFQRFPALISLEAVAELNQVTSTETEWRIGAATTLTRLDDFLSAEFPVIREMLSVFGSRQIRNRATIGGNLVTASPIGDSAPVLLALEASVVLASATGERVLPLEEFFVAYRETALQPGEILKSVVLPRPQPDVTMHRRFFKVSKRREMDISTVAACFAVELDAAGLISKARLAYGGVAALPVRARKTEAALIGKTWSAASGEEVVPVLAQEFIPISDVRGSATYRQQVIVNLLRKFCGNDESRSRTCRSTSLRRETPRRLGGLPHESAHKHVTGEAIYVDDHPGEQMLLEVWPVCSPHAHAKILRRDASAARAMPGISAVLLAEDVPGLNDVGAVRHDEILLADKEVFYHGQIVALVVGETEELCRAAAAKVVVEYEPLPPIFAIEEAIAAGSFHTDPAFIRRGNVSTALADAPLTFEGELSFGGQDHFYLETNAAWAEAGEDGSVFISSSTQHPSEVQHIVAHLLGIPMHSVIVECLRMGGGFGGKETQAAMPAALAALVATMTGRKVRVRFNRDQDMMITGKRHPFLAKFRVGFDTDGMVLAAQVDLFSNGGWSLDLSRAITDRALFHLDNAYYIPNVEVSGRVAKTNVASNTAFRGFGGPQGMLVIEEIIDRVARATGLAPEIVRARNLYRGTGETNTTHYGQEIENNRIQRIWHELTESSDFAARRDQLREWNSQHPHRKRGIAITPVKFGISFTTTHLNQAGALVLLYQDGTIQVNHGGTEMGQGVYTNIALIAARELGLTPDRVRVMATRTDKVPNTSATAASCGTDLNGAAVKNACDTLRERLRPFAAQMLSENASATVVAGVSPALSQGVIFKDNVVSLADDSTTSVSFAEVVQRAYFARTSLSATGFYRTPDINYDREAGRGKPFHYYAVGAAVSEVEVDGFTGMSQIRRVDILHDVGDAINPGITLGQIEGGFVQGAGWLTNEELIWDSEGRLLTHSPDTYKIPAVGDTPEIFNVAFLSDATQSTVVHGSKAVGEPPLMLALSVREAIRDAVAAFGDTGRQVPLASPATPEAILKAIEGK